MERRLPPSLLLVAALAGCLTSVGATAATTATCTGAALARLSAASRDGAATYARAADPGSFTAWIDCDDAQFGLPTAVHEATHLETVETDAFSLVGGGSVARPHEVAAFFPPARLARDFESDDFTAIYLTRGKASSAVDVLYLLDEFNAYTHDLAVAVDLRALSRAEETVDHRDGLAAMMAFVAAYAEAARDGEPQTWEGLRAPRVAGAVRALWSRAERVMAASCGIPGYGTRDKAYIRRVCDAGPRSALATVLGRAPACAADCLAASEEGDAPGVDDNTSDSNPTAEFIVPIDARARHPFADASLPRRHRAAAINE